MDLFAHAAAGQAPLASNAQFDAIWNSPAARTRRRRIGLDLTRGLIDEARRCRLEGWPCAAAWWLAEAGRERRRATSKGDTQSPLRGDLAASGQACRAETPAIQRMAKGDTQSPLEGDR